MFVRLYRNSVLQEVSLTKFELGNSCHVKSQLNQGSSWKCVVNMWSQRTEVDRSHSEATIALEWPGPS